MSSSSSHTYRKFDVFVSFRGEDIRGGFLSHLKEALSNARISSFIDDKLEKGEDIWPALSKAIEGSRISLIIFSRGYASSRWCLNELYKIMQCCKTLGQIVVPVFYGVDPREVRHQTGAFGEGLKALERRYLLPDGLKTWRSALNEAANLTGWDSRNDRNDANLVKKIVEDIIDKLDMDLLPITEFPVGLESRVQQLIKFING